MAMQNCSHGYKTASSTKLTPTQHNTRHNLDVIAKPQPSKLRSRHRKEPARHSILLRISYMPCTAPRAEAEKLRTYICSIFSNFKSFKRLANLIAKRRPFSAVSKPIVGSKEQILRQKALDEIYKIQILLHR